jgi:hypothetical protein
MTFTDPMWALLVDCWDRDPDKRPTMESVTIRLEHPGIAVSEDVLHVMVQVTHLFTKGCYVPENQTALPTSQCIFFSFNVRLDTDRLGSGRRVCRSERPGTADNTNDI